MENETKKKYYPKWETKATLQYRKLPKKYRVGEKKNRLYTSEFIRLTITLQVIYSFFVHASESGLKHTHTHSHNAVEIIIYIFTKCISWILDNERAHTVSDMHNMHYTSFPIIFDSVRSQANYVNLSTAIFLRAFQVFNCLVLLHYFSFSLTLNGVIVLILSPPRVWINICYHISGRERERERKLQR